MRRLALLAAVCGGFASSASAYAPETGEFRIIDNGPYAYLFARPSRAEVEDRTGPYGYLFRHQFPEHRAAVVNRRDLFSGEPDRLR